MISTPQIAPEDDNPEQAGHNSWREQMSAENEMRVANMTEEERETERREILERFGTGVGSVLKHARLARERSSAKDFWSNHKQRPPPPPSEADSEAFKKMPEGMFFNSSVTIHGLTSRFVATSANI
jgi:hypothetical protein